MQLLQSALRVYLIYPHSIVETSHDQLPPNDVSPVDWNLIASHFVLIPKEDKLVLIPRQQHRAKHQTHPQRFLVVGVMLHDNVERVTFKQQAGGVVTDENRGRL
jgi:hypothetical protein